MGGTLEVTPPPTLGDTPQIVRFYNRILKNVGKCWENVGKLRKIVRFYNLEGTAGVPLEVPPEVPLGAPQGCPWGNDLGMLTGAARK